MRDVRETNICRISVHRDERTGRVIVFGAIDNLWKGAASEAVQNLNLMFGLPEGEGIDHGEPVEQSFFSSRWVEVPGSVSRGRRRRAAGRLPRRRRRLRDQAERRGATSACSSRDAPADDQRRALHPLAARSRRRCC